MKFIIFILSCILLLQPFAYADNSAGTKAFNFLKVPIGARASALSNAYYALSNDHLASFYNPAGLAQVQTKDISFTFMNYLVGYNGGALSVTFPINNSSTFAIFTKFTGAGGIDKTDIDLDTGELIDLDETFGTYDVLLGVSYGKILSEILDFGINLKMISETIDEYSSQAAAADIALIHQTPNPKLKFGLAAKNLGMQITKFDKKKEDLPIQFHAGFSYNISRGYFNLDLVKPLDQDVYANIGLEKEMYKNFIMRLGYKSNATDWQVGSNIDFLAGISTGFGFNWKNYKFDYALNSFGELGFIHQLTVARNF